VKLKWKIVLFLLPLTLWIGCKSVVGPDKDTDPKPTTVRVDYHRYVAGGTSPELADTVTTTLTWGGINGTSQYLIKQDDINYSCSVSIETENVITGYVGDFKMYDPDNPCPGSNGEIALYVRIDGVDVIRISNGCTSPWSGTFKFIKHNDGMVEMLKQ